LEMTVAVKVLSERLLSDPRAIARFDREMKSVGQLDHPNIIRASDAGEIDGKHFLVMELVSGEDLSAIAQRRGPLAIADACEAVRQAALGLQHACDNGLVHRDIKPANLMLNQRGCVKILDMGLALLDTPMGGNGDGLTVAGQMMGTVDYMAPEQISDSHKVDIRADIYALGCTIYRLLCGSAPFQDAKYSNAYTKARAHCDTLPPPLSERRGDLPRPLIAIIDKMLAKNPNDRWQSPADIAAALTPFAIGHNLPALLTDSPIATKSGVAAETPTEAHLSTAQRQSQVSGDLASPLPQGSSTRTLTRNKITIAVGVFGLLLAMLSVTMLLNTPAGILRIEINDPGIELEIKGTQYVLKGAEANDISLTPGDHILHIRRGDFEFDTKSLQLSKGEVVVVKVELIQGMIQVTSDGAVLSAKSLPINPNPAEPDASDRNRIVAQWVLSLGGSVDIDAATYTQPNAIPSTPFQITGVSLHQKDVGIHNIKDADVARFADLKRLKKLNLDGAAITDAGLAHLEPLSVLRDLKLRGTQVTSTGVEKLQKALPECKIEWSTALRTSAPPTPGNDANALAQLAIANHGQVIARINDRVVDFDNPSQVPDEPFIVTGINFTKPFVPSDSDMETLRQSSTLSHLEFSDLELSDRVMKKLILLPQLAIFRLRYDEAAPQGLERLADLPHLSDLTVGGEYVGDEEVAMLKGIKNAFALTISGKRVTDAGLVHLAEMTHLQFVSLLFTRVEGSGLVHLTKLPKLWSLQTPYTPLNDSAAESLSQMKAVTWLNLAFTQVGDEALKRIVAMPKLEDLDLTQTQITNGGIAFLQPSTSLRRLHVAAPRIDDGALEALSKLTQLTFLSVGGRMSAEAVETLRTRLPNCQIHATPRGD